ncbi:MAG: hypothetical protein ABWK05_05210 [Pyrobaculum sp.]
MAEGRDVERGKKLLIPPFLTPQQEKKEQKRGERRAKIKAADVEEGVVKLPKDVFEELGNPQEVEVVAPGGSSHEKRKVFRAVLDEKIPGGEVYVSQEDLRALGVAENTVVTIRKR